MPETTITALQSRTSTINRNIEIFSLTPSTLLTLWEIDASLLLEETGELDQLNKLKNYDSVFRFHNSVTTFITLYARESINVKR